MKFAALITFAYLLGSIPFGQIIAKAHGKDLRTIGSGNIGATNLARALGKKWAYICFFLDVAKGFAPVFAATKLFSNPPALAELALALVVAIAAVIGHIFPIYLKFKGGKGVATSFGVALGFWPYYTACSVIVFIIWAIVVLISRYVSLASIVAAIFFPVTLITAIAIVPHWHLANLWPLLAVAAIMPILVINRHKGNIKRLANGTEGKILQKKPENLP
jgi:glycerol-3-phosphate acyltransferase PlsY